MKKIILIACSFLLLAVFSSFTVHKFYVSIYQINFNQKNQRLEISSRIFIDDMNNVLKFKYNKKTHLTDPNETIEDVELMKKYLLENLSIKINGKTQIINYLKKETDNNVIVSYFTIKNISKITTIDIKNTSLFDLTEEQQNIIQTTIYGKKEDLLLTPSTTSGILKF